MSQIVSEPSRNCVGSTTIAYRGDWYPFRMRKPDRDGRSDRFLPGSAFDDVVALYVLMRDLG